MPGANCSIYECSTNRNHKELSNFRVPTGDDEFSTKWRDKIVNIITKDRVIDEKLGKQIKNRTLHTCELHYREEDLLRHETKTTRKPGALPTLRLPSKSHPKVEVSPRSSSSISKRELATASAPTAPPNANLDCYTSYENFTTRIEKLKLPDWTIKNNEAASETSILLHDSIHSVPKFEIRVKENLDFFILVFNWLVPQSNTDIGYSSMKSTYLSPLTRSIEHLFVCRGVSYSSDAILRHPVPKKLYDVNAGPFQMTEFLRPKDCQILSQSDICKTCLLKTKQHESYEERKKAKSLEPLKRNAPLSSASSSRLKVTVQGLRIENKELKTEIEKLQKELAKNSLPVDDTLDNDLKSIMSRTDSQEISPFMKFFWEQQQQYIKCSPSGVRYHPSIIKYCLSLHAKSASAYKDLRHDPKTGTGILVLPSERRLRHYKNYIRPQRGFNSEIIDELKGKIANFTDDEKYICILLDEMKIQENLVFDKHSGELIGYVDLGDIVLNSASFENIETIATHILVVMVRGIINPIKFSFATFGTDGANSSQLFAIFWKATGILELSCKLKVLAVTCDGASSNRKFFRMHAKLEGSEDKDVTYKTKNRFSTDNRYIHFISDPPHLMKTARNCLSNSGAGRNSRYMWNNGNILWSHISDAFYNDQESGLHYLPKLTTEHIKLTPYSVMNVKLATQVLSQTVGNHLKEYVPEAKSTSDFCLMMDTFFDIMNIRNPEEAKKKLKENNKPIYKSNDGRIKWLKDHFLGYFKKWLESINNREGKFDKTAKAKMFISWQTYEGLQITVKSVIDCVEYLLDTVKCKFVLTEHFNQDPLENYFGRQRSLGSRKENPSLFDAGYNDNSIRNQNVCRSIEGGNSGGVDHSFVDMSNEPMFKKQRVTE